MRFRFSDDLFHDVCRKFNYYPHLISKLIIKRETVLLKYYGLPFWVVGVIASFALPSVPHWGVLLAAALVLLAASRRFAAAGMMLCVLLGFAYGVFRTEAALSAQWPLNGASESVLTVEVADMPRGEGRRVQFAAKAWKEDGREVDLLL